MVVIDERELTIKDPDDIMEEVSFRRRTIDGEAFCEVSVWGRNSNQVDLTMDQLDTVIDYLTKIRDEGKQLNESK